MSPSNKLSARRGFLKRPPVCKKSPTGAPDPDLDIYWEHPELSTSAHAAIANALFARNTRYADGDPLTVVIRPQAGTWRWNSDPLNGLLNGGEWTAPGTPGIYWVRATVTWPDTSRAISVFRITVTGS
jgi:hypothetical protein